MAGKTSFTTNPQPYRINGGGISVANPGAESPRRVSWADLLAVVDAVHDNASSFGPEFRGDLERAYIVLSAMALRHGYDPKTPLP